MRVRDALQSSAGPSRARAAFQLGCCASGPLSGSQSANDDGRAAGVALSQLHGHASIDGRRPGTMSARTQRAQQTAAGGAHRRRGEGCSDEVKPGLLGGGRAAYRGHAGRSAADGSCMAASRSGAASKCGLAASKCGLLYLRSTQKWLHFTRASPVSSFRSGPRPNHPRLGEPEQRCRHGPHLTIHGTAFDVVFQFFSNTKNGDPSSHGSRSGSNLLAIELFSR